MDSKSEIRCSSLGSFPMTGGYEFAIQFFEGSNVNEEIMGRQQKEEQVLW